MNDQVIKQQGCTDKTLTQCNWISLHRKETAAKSISEMTDGRRAALWLPTKKGKTTLEENHLPCCTSFCMHLSSEVKY